MKIKSEIIESILKEAQAEPSEKEQEYFAKQEIERRKQKPQQFLFLVAQLQKLLHVYGIAQVIADLIVAEEKETGRKIDIKWKTK